MPGPKLGQTQQTSVVIVTWNGGPLLETCVQAIHQQTLVPKRVVVVVARPQKVPVPNNVDVIYSPRAQGYAASVNLGLSVVPDDLIVVLNDDTQPEPDFLSQLNQAFEERGEGIFCPRILLAETGRHLDRTVCSLMVHLPRSVPPESISSLEVVSRERIHVESSFANRWACSMPTWKFW